MGSRIAGAPAANGRAAAGWPVLGRRHGAARTRPPAAAAPTEAGAAEAPPGPPPRPDYDRIPALFAAEDAFSLRSYWDRRYSTSALDGIGADSSADGRAPPPPPPPAEEWYRGGGCEATRAVICAHLDAAAPVLQVGVGTSRLQEAMAAGFPDELDKGSDEQQQQQQQEQDGGASADGGDGASSSSSFASVLSVDYSPVAIERQQARLLRLSQARTPWAPRLSYARADARRMPQFADGAFGGGVLDKGALDALLCGDDADEAACEMLTEVWRVLASGGAYVMITSAAPAGRRRLLPTQEARAAAAAEARAAAEEERGDAEGGVEDEDGQRQQAAAPPPPGATAGEPRGGRLPFPVWAGALVYRLGQQGALAGPASLGDEGAEAALLAAGEGDSRFAYSHFAYVCVKG